jgi:PEP-CTERM motif
MQVRGSVIRLLTAGMFAAVASTMVAQTAEAIPVSAFNNAGLNAAEWTELAPGTFGTGGTYDYFGAGGNVTFELRSASFHHLFGTSDANGDLPNSQVIFDTKVDTVGALKFFTPLENPFTFFFQNQNPNTFFVKSNGVSDDPSGTLNFGIAQNIANPYLFAFFFDDGGPNGPGDDNDYNDMVITADATPVPEPATILLLGAGLLGGASRLRRKK